MPTRHDAENDDHRIVQVTKGQVNRWEQMGKDYEKILLLYQFIKWVCAMIIMLGGVIIAIKAIKAGWI